MVDAYRSRGDGDSTETLGLCLSPGGRTATASLSGFTYPGYSGKTSAHTVSVSPMNKHYSPKTTKRAGSFTGSPASGYVRRHQRTQSNVSNVSFVSHASSACGEVNGDRNKTLTLTTSPYSSGSNEELKEIIVLAEKAPKMLFCLLCHNVFRDPYVCTCGHTFCQSCVLSHKYETCPIHNEQLALVVANIAVAEQVGELLVHCRYGCQPKPDMPEEYEVASSGCPVVVKMHQRQEHEVECEFAPSPCPNSSLCPMMLKKELAEHLLTCKHVRCPHSKYNCPFEGTREELVVHLENCRYEGLKEYLQRTDEHMVVMQEELRKKDEEIEFLRSMLVRLSEKLETLDKTTSLRSRLEEQQLQVHQQLGDAHQGIRFAVVDEIHHVQAQLGVTGTMDSQHLYRCKGTFVGHEGPVWTLCVQGETMCSGSSDNTIKIWDMGDQFKCLRTLTGHDGIVLALCLHKDHLYSSSEDKTIRVWNIHSGEFVHRIEADENPISSLAHSGVLLFSGSLKTIKVWNIHTYAVVHEFPEQNHWVRALVVHGKSLFSGSYKTVKIWSLDSYECLREMHCSGGSVYSMTLTNKYLVCGTYENCISVWDVNGWEYLGTLEGHRGTVYDLAALETPGQTKLFSASYDKTIRVWNIEHMRCMQALTRHEGSVVCLAISRGRLFSGSVDSSIKIWQ